MTVLNIQSGLHRNVDKDPCPARAQARRATSPVGAILVQPLECNVPSVCVGAQGCVTAFTSTGYSWGKGRDNNSVQRFG